MSKTNGAPDPHLKERACGAHVVKLLTDLGYAERNGTFRNPDPNRMVIFLGDIIDRGPDQLGSIDIVRRMMDAGTAHCLMGNHEHAAIGWLLPDPSIPGEYMRVHSEKNFRQHRVFLDQIGSDPTVRKDVQAWMETLPLYLDLPGIRCVHACWHPEIIDKLRRLTSDRHAPWAGSLRQLPPGKRDA
ncbi:hypothetical protein GOB57_07680 [Sinorhizobium meliloti]|nr:hypothetical protein [Sinorhizobium meliloti]